MQYYVEITLRPDAETGLGFLWQKVFQQIHLALVEIKDENGNVNVGISFPKYNDKTFRLGNSLRLFAQTKDDLEKLRLDQWLKRLLDYVSVSDIKHVPDDIEIYVSFFRQQFKSSSERLARRQAKRKGISFEEAMKNYEMMEEQTSELPFIIFNSLSSAQKLKVFIQKEVKNVDSAGSFNTFGLSKSATVPWF